MSTIRRDIEVQARIVDDLLDLSRFTSGKLIRAHLQGTSYLGSATAPIIAIDTDLMTPYLLRPPVPIVMVPELLRRIGEGDRGR